MKPCEKKFVVMGAHGPVCLENSPRRFIGAEPVEVEMSSYYIRRMADGELVEVKAVAIVEAPKVSKKKDE
jgi:hypothetical protein